jgi:HPt (histidine-containing phosphotransfer) domain-containing protein
VPSESTPSVRADLLDTDLLQELSMLDRAKPGLLTDLHNRFLARRGAQLQELDTASEQGDLDRIRSLCHSIKGGAGALAMARLAEFAAAIEAQPQQLQLQPAMKQQFSTLLDDSLRALRTWIDGPR